MNIKKPSNADYPDIYHLLDRAFAPSIAEANLVSSLNDAGKIKLDLVIEQQGRILGYICYSAAVDDSGTAIGYHLAPLAVLPERQRQGLGHQLTRKSLRLLSGSMPVYVLGDPEYYRRFGFRIDKTQKCIFDPEGDHFMVLFAGPLPAREVFYEREFHELG
jgi:putative acetyltransferase